MDEWQQILAALEQTTARAVLATILRVEGSSYRKAGATMLLLDDGRQVGLLSAGCLETDLAARAEALFAEGKAFAGETGRMASYTVRYDLRAEDDLAYGQGAGCNGVIHVLVEPVDLRMRKHLQAVKACLEQGSRVLGLRRLTQAGRVSGYLFLTEQKRFGEWTGELPTAWQELYEEGKGVPHPSGMRRLANEAGAGEAWVQWICPRPRLILFGAGPDVKPLASMAAQVGFAVLVADWRPAYCHPGHFPQAEALVLGWPEQIVEQLHLTPEDSVVVMTHDFQRDKELLHLLLPKKLRYLGLLGPRRRTERLLEGTAWPEFVHAPVGVAIGAEGPAEIAVSILAELIQNLRQNENTT